MNRGGLDPMWQAGVGVRAAASAEAARERPRRGRGAVARQRAARGVREAAAALPDRGAPGPARRHGDDRGPLRQGDHPAGPHVGGRGRRQLPVGQGAVRRRARGAHDALQRPHGAPFAAGRPRAGSREPRRGGPRGNRGHRDEAIDARALRGRARRRRRGRLAARRAQRAPAAAPAAAARPLPLPDAPELRLRQARRLPDLRHEARADRGRRFRPRPRAFPVEPPSRCRPSAARCSASAARRSTTGRSPGRSGPWGAWRSTSGGSTTSTPSTTATWSTCTWTSPASSSSGASRSCPSTARSSWPRSRSTCSPTRRASGCSESGIPSVAQGSLDLLEAARQRLLLWDIRPEDIANLEREGKVGRTLDLHSEVAGYVVQKMAFHGMRVTPADPLFDIADLRHVWVLADVYESDLPLVRIGMQGELTRRLPAGPAAGAARSPTSTRRSRRRPARSRSGSRSTTRTGSSSPTCSSTSSCARTSARASRSRRAP